LNNVDCVRVIEFDAGHRLVNHEGKCAKLHGHRYRCEVFCVGSHLDSVGRVVDFGVIKERVGGWIDEHWDHNFLMNVADGRLADFIMKELNQKVYFLDTNPTVENMALYLLNNVCPKVLVGTDVTCVKIRLWETPNCFVEVSKKY
jgi:6-pyruvoyltetrahydropterin/6-carboxytetrahydropterin synthase